MKSVSAFPLHSPRFEGFIGEEGSAGIGNDPKQGGRQAPIKCQESLFVVDFAENGVEVLVLGAGRDCHDCPRPVQRVRAHLSSRACKTSCDESEISWRVWTSDPKTGLVLLEGHEVDGRVGNNPRKSSCVPSPERKETIVSIAMSEPS